MIGLRSRTSPASMRAPTERRAPATLRRVELRLSHLCATHDRHFGDWRILRAQPDLSYPVVVTPAAAITSLLRFPKVQFPLVNDRSDGEL
jgi:hypothetical protein